MEVKSSVNSDFTMMKTSVGANLLSDAKFRMTKLEDARQESQATETNNSFIGDPMEASGMELDDMLLGGSVILFFK